MKIYNQPYSSIIERILTNKQPPKDLNAVVLIVAAVIPVVPKLPAQQCVFLSSPFWTQFCNRGTEHTVRWLGIQTVAPKSSNVGQIIVIFFCLSGTSILSVSPPSRQPLLLGFQGQRPARNKGPDPWPQSPSPAHLLWPARGWEKVIVLWD